MAGTSAYTKEWITEVRGGLDKSSFGRQIIAFKKNNTVCASVHRNTIGNWESGKTALPKDVETVLSIALFEYDKIHKEDGAALDRSARYLHARKRLEQMLGLELYCRNLHDALLISVCRGILSFKELLPLERELEAELEKDALPNEMRDLYAIERNTVPISEDLNKVSSLEELRACITQYHRHSFASASRIIGARILQIYRSRSRYPQEVSFYRAVANLAPNYRDSYIRIFSSVFISRDWIIDLCRHLRFDRAEITDVLEAAHMAKLTEDEIFPDSMSMFAELPAVLKLETMLLLALYVDERVLGDLEHYPPAIHLLESFTLYEHGKAARQSLDKLLEKEEAADWSCEDLRERLVCTWTNKQGREMYSPCSVWMKYLDQDNSKLREEESLQQICRELTPAYEQLPAYVSEDLKGADGRKAAQEARDEMRRIRYLVSMCFTVLSGTIFRGTLTEADLNAIQRSFAKEEKDCTYIYRFISKMLVIFLGDRPVQQTDKGCFDLADTMAGKRKTALGMENIQETFWESILFLKGLL